MWAGLLGSIRSVAVLPSAHLWFAVPLLVSSFFTSMYLVPLLGLIQSFWPRLSKAFCSQELTLLLSTRPFAGSTRLISRSGCVPFFMVGAGKMVGSDMSLPL